jgi:GxxExxY protein
MKPERRINLFDERLTHSIIGGFFEVYNYYGFGLAEKVYANALEIELKERCHKVDREVWILIHYKGTPVAWQRIDMIVDGKVIVESKASAHLPPAAEPQLLSYVRATRLELGLLLHFGLTPYFRRLIASNRRPNPTETPEPTD